MTCVATRLFPWCFGFHRLVAVTDRLIQIMRCDGLEFHTKPIDIAEFLDWLSRFGPISFKQADFFRFVIEIETAERSDE